MSGKVKSRGSTNSANTLEAATTTLNERILKVRENVEKKKKVYRSATHCHIVGDNLSRIVTLSHIVQECHTLYADPEHGLISIAETLGLKLLAPRKKITIMLIGNHSAGKSSFINW